MPSRRKSSVKRNLLLLALLTLTTVVLIAAVGMRQRQPVFIFEAPLSAEARMRDPDNAYPLLVEAEALLPKLGATHFSTLFVGWKSEFFNQIQRRAWNGLLQLSLAEGDTQAIREFLKSAGPAFAKTSEALARPKLLFPESRSHLWDDSLRFQTLAFTHIIAGAGDLQAFPVQERINHLVQTIRLARLLAQEGSNFQALQLESAAFTALCRLAVRAQSPQELDPIQAALDAVPTPYGDRAASLEHFWRAIDDALALPRPTEKDRDMGEIIGGRAYAWFLQQQAAYVREHQAELREWAALKPGEFRERLEESLKSAHLAGPVRETLEQQAQVVSLAARTHAMYEAARLCLALERHRLAHKTYPDQLALLAPTYLPTLPTDPTTGEPFVFTNKGGNYLLTSSDAATLTERRAANAAFISPRLWALPGEAVEP